MDCNKDDLVISAEGFASGIAYQGNHNFDACLWTDDDFDLRSGL